MGQHWEQLWGASHPSEIQTSVTYLHCKPEISEKPWDEQCPTQVIADNTEYTKLELQRSGCHMKASPSLMAEAANKGTLVL